MYDVLSRIEGFEISSVEQLLIVMLLFSLTFFVLIHVRAKFKKPPQSSKDDMERWDYEKLPVAWPTIFIIWSLLCLVLIRIYALLPEGWLINLDREIVEDPLRQLFLIYAVGFVSMWITYLASLQNNILFKVRTLRRLLNLYSNNWGDVLQDANSPEPKDIHALNRMYEKKARSSISSISLLVAAAAVVLGLVNETSLRTGAGVEVSMWEVTMLWLAAATAISAFFCFVVAADVLETVFNEFKTPYLNRKISKNLYDYAINPKYYGLIFLISSVALFAAARNPSFGALALAIATFIGYGHWFPRLVPRRGAEKLEWLLRIGIVLLPALFVLKVL